MSDMKVGDTVYVKQENRAVLVAVRGINANGANKVEQVRDSGQQLRIVGMPKACWLTSDLFQKTK